MKTTAKIPGLQVGHQFDEVAIGYDFMETIFNNNDFFLSLLPPRCDSALDIGCGSGILAEALSPYFTQVTGIDISAGMLALARERRPLPNVDYRRQDAHDLSADEHYDYIVSRTTFHHLEDIPAVLERLKTIINPGGHIVILDCVSPVATPPRWSYLVGAYGEFLPNCRKLGTSVARKILKFRISRPWLDHLASDRYLSENAFHAVFTKALPGCTITRVQSFFGAIWKAEP
ncbi:MAG TPA: methyltransferase domain-containing protein [Armatimonadota bacterium]|nr:methyltransferase domain-containing protein [Armatimonadota bacterium]